MRIVKNPLGYFSILFLLSPYAYSQTGNSLNCEKMYEVLRTTTIVVLDDEASPYNQVLTSTLDSLWTLTPLEYIPQRQLVLYLGNPDYTILIKNNATRVERRVSGDAEINFNEIGLYPSYRALELEDFHARDAYAKIRVENVDQPEGYVYKLSPLLHAMHHYLVYASQGHIRENTYQKDMKGFLKLHGSKLGQKTLYIEQKDLINSTIQMEKLGELYPYPIRVVPQTQLHQLIDIRDKKAAFLHLHPYLADFLIIDVESGKILYGDEPIQYGIFQETDLEKIGRAVSGRKGKWKLNGLF